MPAEIVEGLVSVIIPVRNRPRMIREAIASVQAQTWKDWEVVVADDVSTDDTVSVVEELSQADPRIRLVRRVGTSGGPGVAREAARQQIRGEFVQYLDSDDLLLPDKFKLQIAALRSAPECDIAYGWTKVQKLDGTIDERPGKHTGELRSNLFPGLLVDRWWFTSSPLYRRSLTDRIGPWPTLRWGQDWAYDSIAGALGAALKPVEAFVSVHRHHAGDRQTGEYAWFKGDRLIAYHDLQVTILRSAITAGVPVGTPEMVHFARLQFKIARSLAAEGLQREASEALEMVRAAYGNTGPVDVRIYSVLSHWVGARLVGRIAIMRDAPPWRKTTT